jgi:hypothetical protein
MALPWTSALWVQSMCGRRLPSCIGPVAPMMKIGARSM